MHIVFFSHPLFLGSQSMPRFTNMLVDGMRERGHEVEIWRPEPLMVKLPLTKIKKWLGYFDQYVIFPLKVKLKIRKMPKEVLYVMIDHALGPYVPLVASRPHVIHCHDFLAQQSALAQIPENITSRTGQKYQSFIRDGYSKGENFISVSKKTKFDLEKFLSKMPLISEVVYNGLNPKFIPFSVPEGRNVLTAQLAINLNQGFILHVGGNQWYKNRVGVVAIYDRWRTLYSKRIPLILIGERPSQLIVDRYNSSPFKGDIYFLSDIDDETVRLAYSSASVFLFPSIAEGFGWPIAEGMASGTIVITTNENPMIEVAGDAAFLISRKPYDQDAHSEWESNSAEVLNSALELNPAERSIKIKNGFKNIERFKLDDALDTIENIYLKVLSKL